MGSLFSAFGIGISGLNAAQVQLNVAAHNIANVNREGFSRQRIELTARPPANLSFGALGQGVDARRVVRLRDAFLDSAFQRQVSDLGSAEVLARFYGQVEDLFLEPTDSGFSTRLSAFFDALNDFASNVESLPARQAVLAEAQSLAGSFNSFARQIDVLRSDANEQVRHYVTEINGLTSNISLLNEQIRRTEAGGQTANDLRDERGQLLDQLGRLINITAREDATGLVQVFLGDVELVSATGARTLTVERDASIDPRRPDFLRVGVEGLTQPVTVSGGELFAALEMRDVTLAQTLGDLDTLAAGLIRQINTIHAVGTGLTGITQPIRSGVAVGDTAAALSGQLVFPFSAGTFQVNLIDPVTNSRQVTAITVDPSMSLEDLAAQLDAVTDLTAAVSDGRITITPGGGRQLAFSADTSELLTALGLNGLFEGVDAASMAVNPTLLANPASLTSGTSLDPRDTGDNRAAVALASVQHALFYESGSMTVNDFYESIVVQLGVDSRSNAQDLEVQRAFVTNLEQRRQEVAGVNLDEEVTGLLRFQRAYEASARVITITDRMLEALFNTAL